MIDTRSSDHRWQAVLAGRLQPDDDESRAVAMLRQSLRQAGPVEAEPLDHATHTRVMNALRARGAFSPTAHHRARAAAGSVSAAAGNAAAKRWVPGLAWLRWSAPASVLVASITLPLAWMQQQEQEAADPPMHLVLKHLPAAQTVRVAHPEAEAGRLGALLSLHGASVSVQTDGAARLVSAELPSRRWAELEPLLMQQGLTVEPGGRLAVRFAPLGR